MTTRPQDLTCDRCGIGFVLSNAALAKRTQRGNTDSLCPDCETIDKPIIGYYDNCRAWQGECDEFDRPIRNGKLWKPGVRICGRADCVRIAHIQTDMDALEAERHDLSYRGKPSLTLEDLKKAVERERYRL